MRSVLVAAYLQQFADLANRQREAALRDMLGQWGSETEPSLAYGSNGDLLGLTMAGIPLGTRAPIVVEVPGWYREPRELLSNPQ